MKYALLFAFLVFSSCSEPTEKKEIKTYADLKGFFDAEVRRLTKSDPQIKKTVARNHDSETRNVKKIDWKSELSLFAESDINKPAWQDSYRVIKQGTKTIYLATDNDLRTREISISKDIKGKIMKISILNHEKNMLYSSTEQLLYIPDSIYQISKQQHVAVIGDNRYYISGAF
jgi:hypothetical protein